MVAAGGVMWNFLVLYGKGSESEKLSSSRDHRGPSAVDTVAANELGGPPPFMMSYWTLINVFPSVLKAADAIVVDWFAPICRTPP